MMHVCREYLRNEMLQWGYPKDEYTDNNNFSRSYTYAKAAA